TPAPSPSPGAANPAPAPTPAPTPTPSPTPTPGNNPDMFQAPMMAGNGDMRGQITVNASANNGASSLTLTGAPANTSLTLQFCPFNPDTYGKGGAPCYDLTNVMTDASGNSTST